MRHHAALTFGERRRASRRPTFVTEIVEYFLGAPFHSGGKTKCPFRKGFQGRSNTDIRTSSARSLRKCLRSFRCVKEWPRLNLSAASLDRLRGSLLRLIFPAKVRDDEGLSRGAWVR